jgi:4'-phosphopantetheinyl transferase
VPIFEPEWQCPPENLVCTEHEVHIWCAALGLKPEILQWYAQILSLDEQQRANRFRFERDRHRFIASRGILRSILGRYLRLEASRLEFRYGNTGKPALENFLNPICLEFNLSHTQDLMVCAVTVVHSLGIDLEGMRSIADLQSLTQRFFSPREHQAIQSLPAAQQPFAFLQYWTCKEAILKATGSGLGHLSQVELQLVGAEVTIVRLGESLYTPLFLYPFIPTSNHLAALATTQPGCQIRFWRWAFQTLV